MNDIDEKNLDDEKRRERRKKLKEEIRLLEEKNKKMKQIVIYVCLFVIVLFSVLFYFSKNKEGNNVAQNPPSQEQLTLALIYSVDIDEARFGNETSKPYYDNQRQMVREFQLDSCVYDELNSYWICKVFFQDREAELVLEKTDWGYMIKKG